MKILKINGVKGVNTSQQKAINGGIRVIDNNNPNPCGATPGIILYLPQQTCLNNGGIWYQNKCYLCQ